MLHSENLKSLTPAAMAALGAEQIAYVRPVMIDDHLQYAVHAADGTQMALFADRATAFAACVQHDLEPHSVH